MDPDTTLRVIRGMIVEENARTGEHPISSSELIERFGLLVEHVEALDRWISCGGFLPDAWRPPEQCGCEHNSTTVDYVTVCEDCGDYLDQ